MEVLQVLEQLPKATVASWLLGAAVATFLLRTVMQWYRLSHVPGPFWAAFSKYWMVKQSLRGRQPTAIKEVNDKYGRSYSLRATLGTTWYLYDFALAYRRLPGSLARIGPNELVTDDPEVLRKMMAVRSEYARGPCKYYPDCSRS